MGDLVADRRTPDTGFDAGRAAPKTAEHWHHVHEHTGMPWPVRLRWAPSLSADAAHAVKAAQLQGDRVARALLRAVRESCFVYAAPADTSERILALAATVEDLDAARLADDVASSAVDAAFRADRAETRRPNDYVRNLQETHEGKGNAKPDGDGWRYVFPTLVFRGPDGQATVPGWQPWDRYVDAMEAARARKHARRAAGSHTGRGVGGMAAAHRPRVVVPVRSVCHPALDGENGRLGSGHRVRAAGRTRAVTPRSVRRSRVSASRCDS